MSNIVPYSKKIPLTQGKFATVSYYWYDFLMQWKWHAHKHHGRFYAARGIPGRTGRVLLRLHRVILGLNNPNLYGDHKDRDGLNNTEGNLRIATPQQNSANRKSMKGSSSKYLGVSVSGKNWITQININKRSNLVGRFPLTPCGELLAAITYDNYARQVHGEFANLNFK